MKLHQILYFDYLCPAPADGLLLVVLSATRFSSAQEPKLSPEKQPQIEAAIQRSWLARTSLASPPR